MRNNAVGQTSKNLGGMRLGAKSWLPGSRLSRNGRRISPCLFHQHMPYRQPFHPISWTCRYWFISGLCAAMDRSCHTASIRSIYSEKLLPQPWRPRNFWTETASVVPTLRFRCIICSAQILPFYLLLSLLSSPTHPSAA